MSPTTEYREYRYRAPGAGAPPPSERKPATTIASTNTGSKRHSCPNCRPVVHAHFRDGELASIQLHHQWRADCNGLIEPLELDDWIDHAVNYPPRDPQAVSIDNTPDEPGTAKRGPRAHTEPKRRIRKATT